MIASRKVVELFIAMHERALLDSTGSVREQIAIAFDNLAKLDQIDLLVVMQIGVMLRGGGKLPTLGIIRQEVRDWKEDLREDFIHRYMAEALCLGAEHLKLDKPFKK